MSTATLQALLSVLRSLMIVGGSYLTAAGYLSEGNASELIGAAMVLVPLVWGALGHIFDERKAKAREAVAVNVGIAVANASPGITPLVPAVLVPSLLQTVAPKGRTL